MILSIAEQLVLHERVLAGDPVAPADVFGALLPPIVKALRASAQCTEDDARDSGVDAIYEYLEQPESYDRSHAQLLTFLIHIAKRRALDRLRSASSAREP